MSAVAYARPCGWHVLLSSTGPTMESRLRPHVIGKSCVPYTKPGDQITAQDQLQALVIGLHKIEQQYEEECHNL